MLPSPTQLQLLHWGLPATALLAAAAATWLAHRGRKERSLPALAWVLTLTHPSLWLSTPGQASDRLHTGLLFTALTMGLAVVTAMRPPTEPERPPD